MKNKIELLSTVLLDPLLIDKAANYGIELDTLSFIQVSSNTERDLHAEMEELCDLPITAVFTSANAVRSIGEIVRTAKPHWNIYCIGETTKDAILEYFDVAAIKGVAHDATALAEVIISNDICEVVFFCGDKRLDTLPAALRGADITVHELIVYHTVETQHAVTKHYDGILFFSPSAVSSFFSVNKIGSTTVLFAIGDTTANAVKQQAGNKVIIGEVHSKDQLVEQAIEYFHNQLINEQK
jgi:uroporphyrinogen-III synthase